MPAQAVVQYTKPSLRQRSTNVERGEIRLSSFRTLVRDMLETMRKENGIGIAAPQIGVNRRVIIVETKGGPKVMINPTLSRRSLRKETADEGCLSVKGIFGPVRRHQSLIARGLDEAGRPIEVKAKGLLARIFQHEIDHLDGHLFIDRARRITHGSIDLKAWKRPA